MDKFQAGDQGRVGSGAGASPGSTTAIPTTPGRFNPGVRPRSATPVSASRGGAIARWMFWSAAFVITTTISATVGATLALVTPLSPWMAPAEPGQRSVSDLWRNGFQYRVARPVNILVMGVDRVLDAPQNSPEIFSGRSDTMLLLRVDPVNNSVSMLSIPRDTQVEIPGQGVTKINSANAVGGPALAARVVSRTFNDVPIDRYVRVSTDAFQELVDLLGGVDVYVPYPMSYTDNTQKLKIDLAQGWQTLSGAQAEQFARFRNDAYGDIGRVQRQQALIKALRERLTNPMVVTRIPEMIRVLWKYVDTNLSLEEMLALAHFGVKLDKGDFKMVMLPGRFSAPGEFVASYWIMDPAGRDRVLKQYFEVDSTDLGTTAEAEVTPQELRIAVQNASGEPELSQKVADQLRQQGFRNVYVVQDWSDSQRSTQIIAQQGDLDGAAAVRQTLGVGQVEAASIGDLESDLTIRVGKDWQELKP